MIQRAAEQLLLLKNEVAYHRVYGLTCRNNLVIQKHAKDCPRTIGYQESLSNVQRWLEHRFAGDTQQGRHPRTRDSGLTCQAGD